jgi:uncharacterized protein
MRGDGIGITAAPEENDMNIFSQGWPWYVSGPLIGATMLLLLFLGRRFGLSTNLKTLCSVGGAGRFSDYFADNWRKESWNLVFALGALLGGALMVLLGAKDRFVEISAGTVGNMARLGVGHTPGLLPDALFGTAALASPGLWLFWIIGGFLIGFGTRWANGCTSGHGISGLASLQKGSLLAVVGFFIGGLVTTYLVLPWVFS